MNMNKPEECMIRIAAAMIAACVLTTVAAAQSSSFARSGGDYTISIPDGWTVADPCDSGSGGEAEDVDAICILSADKNTIVNIRSFAIDASTPLSQLV